MEQKTKIILALLQIENVSNLLKDGPYYGFLSSHLLPVKYELERQLSILTNLSNSPKIKE